MQIIDGKSVSAKVKEGLKKESLLLASKGIKPALAVVLVGDDKASQTYVNAKEKACAACEISSFGYKFKEDISENELLNLICNLNNDKSIDGILVQLPLPKHINTDKILATIDPSKDVDGFHALNVGRLVSGLEGFIPCTPLGIMRLLKEYKISLEGKRVCIIGRSNIVGKPMLNLMLNQSATVTICHSKTKNLAQITANSDIIVVAIGIPHFLTKDMVNDGAVVIDVGINRLESGKLVGDVDFENVADKCSFITPVPGGVGQMTIAMLLENTIKSAKIRLKRQNI